MGRIGSDVGASRGRQLLSAGVPRFWARKFECRYGVSTDLENGDVVCAGRSSNAVEARSKITAGRIAYVTATKDKCQMNAQKNCNAPSRTGDLTAPINSALPSHCGTRRKQEKFTLRSYVPGSGRRECDGEFREVPFSQHSCFRFGIERYLVDSESAVEGPGWTRRGGGWRREEMSDKSGAIQ
ncbi:hypothetical protein DFH09DRAFT_1087132 [Mycena vulgaris]|nr:hypothetical protein DFH09DRAFT_1087132 [Mycena vulgaris]